jgi:hypothetical protein
MRILIAATVLTVSAAPVAAQVYVAPRVNSTGTVTQGHMRTAPNSSTLDNYSTRGNLNPYTGKIGTRDPYASSTTPSTSTFSNPFRSARPSRSRY